MANTAGFDTLKRMKSVLPLNFHDPGIVHNRVLVVEGKKFYVKAENLSRTSDFFNNLFNKPVYKDKKEIHLKEVKVDDFEIFLKVIYPGFFEIQESHLRTLYEQSIFFAAPCVVKFCEMFILKNFEKIDKIMLLKLSIDYGLQDFKKNSLDSILENIYIVNRLDLLKIACEHKLDKIKDASMNIFMTNVDYYIRYQTRTTSDRYSDGKPKRVLDAMVRHVKSFDPIQLYEIAAEHDLDVEFKNKVMNLIIINVENLNPIELLKFAFKHNAEDLKKKLRALIYTADRIELYYQCNECTDRIQRLGCTHTPVKAMPLTRNALIAEHIDEILILPKNIKDFVIISSISPI